MQHHRQSQHQQTKVADMQRLLPTTTTTTKVSQEIKPATIVVEMATAAASQLHDATQRTDETNENMKCGHHLGDSDEWNVWRSASLLQQMLLEVVT